MQTSQTRASPGVRPGTVPATATTRPQTSGPVNFADVGRPVLRCSAAKAAAIKRRAKQERTALRHRVVATVAANRTRDSLADLDGRDDSLERCLRAVRAAGRANSTTLVLDETLCAVPEPTHGAAPVNTVTGTRLLMLQPTDAATVCAAIAVDAPKVREVVFTALACPAKPAAIAERCAQALLDLVRGQRLLRLDIDGDHCVLPRAALDAIEDALQRNAMLRDAQRAKRARRRERERLAAEQRASGHGDVCGWEDDASEGELDASAVPPDPDTSDAAADVAAAAIVDAIYAEHDARMGLLQAYMRQLATMVAQARVHTPSVL